MENEFVPYNEALQMKELGFDEKCFGYLNQYGKLTIDHLHTSSRSNLGKMPLACLAPSWQQTFRWFRSKYGILHDIDFGIGWGYGFIPVGNFESIKIPTNFTEGFDTYEEAQLACLQQLIKIVQNEKNIS